MFLVTLPSSLEIRYIRCFLRRCSEEAPRYLLSPTHPPGVSPEVFQLLARSPLLPFFLWENRGRNNIIIHGKEGREIAISWKKLWHCLY